MNCKLIADDDVLVPETSPSSTSAPGQGVPSTIISFKCVVETISLHDCECAYIYAKHASSILCINDNRSCGGYNQSLKPTYIQHVYNIDIKTARHHNVRAEYLLIMSQREK
jgi:hypothetical protein